MADEEPTAHVVVEALIMSCTRVRMNSTRPTVDVDDDVWEGTRQGDMSSLDDVWETKDEINDKSLS